MSLTTPITINRNKCNHHFSSKLLGTYKGFSFCLFLKFLNFFIFRATPTAYGSSQASGWIRATAAGLRHSHSNARSEQRLQPTPQLTANTGSLTTKLGQGSNLQPHGSYSDSLTVVPRWELQVSLVVSHMGSLGTQGFPFITHNNPKEHINISTL